MLKERRIELFGTITLMVCLLLGVMAFLVSCYVYDWSDEEASPALSGDDATDDDDDATDDDDDATDDDDDATDDDDNTTDEEVWTDSTSGLMWQVTSTVGTMNWSNAKSHCQGLGLDGHSDWRLPTISELRSLIRGCDDTETGGDCGVTDECLDSSCLDSPCDGCSSGGGPAGGCYWPSEMEGTCSWYWSSSAVAEYDNSAWLVGFDLGNVVDFSVFHANLVRCVR